jgi:hypothetical protein
MDGAQVESLLLDRSGQVKKELSTSKDKMRVSSMAILVAIVAPVAKIRKAYVIRLAGRAMPGPLAQDMLRMDTVKSVPLWLEASGQAKKEQSMKEEMQQLCLTIQLSTALCVGRRLLWQDHPICKALRSLKISLPTL